MSRDAFLSFGLWKSGARAESELVHHAAYGLPIDSLDVVIIDDSRTMQMILRSMIGTLGVARQRVFDGVDDALEAMVSEPPHIIISDWRMTPVSGYLMARHIRRKVMTPLCFVPIIMVTAHGTRRIVERAVEAGVHYFIVKPLAPRTLHQRIVRLTQDAREFVLHGDRYVIDGSDAHMQNNIRWDALESAKSTSEEPARSDIDGALFAG